MLRMKAFVKTNVADKKTVRKFKKKNLQKKCQMSDQIVARIDDMGGRIDDLEKNIGDLMTQAGMDGPEPAQE